jgi:hypothetical protein
MPDGLLVQDPNLINNLDDLVSFAQSLIKGDIKILCKGSLQEDESVQAEEEFVQMESTDEQDQENTSPQLITPRRVSPNKWRFVLN